MNKFKIGDEVRIVKSISIDPALWGVVGKVDKVYGSTVSPQRYRIVFSKQITIGGYTYGNLDFEDRFLEPSIKYEAVEEKDLKPETFFFGKNPEDESEIENETPTIWEAAVANPWAACIKV